MRTDAFLADLQARVMENPGIGIRPLAREMGVAPCTMKMALNDDLRYFSYRLGSREWPTADRTCSSRIPLRAIQLRVSIEFHKVVVKLDFRH